MQKYLLSIFASLFLTISLSFAQSADEETIKTILKNETTAYYQRNAEAWESVWLHDAKISRAIIDNTNYSSTIGWEKFGPAQIENLKKYPKPVLVEFTNDNYFIRMGGDMAWVEYDQLTKVPAIDPTYKRVSREQRLMVKQNGQWKIAVQVTVDPETFGSDSKMIEANLNTNGYYLLRDKKVEQAIDVFKTNVKLYPESANAYDSLGEAYAMAGNKELAIQHYEQSIKLNPKNENGKAALAKLKQK